MAVLDSDLTLTEPVSYVREYVEDAFTKELEQAAEKEGGKSFVEQVMEDVERLTEQAPTIRELYEKYKALVIEALGSDQLYRNACKNSDKDTAYLEGDAAIKRAVLAAGVDTLTKLYFDNSKFHNDLHREALEETYPIFSEPAQPPIVRDEPSDEPSAVPQPRAPLPQPIRSAIRYILTTQLLPSQTLACLTFSSKTPLFPILFFAPRARKPLKGSCAGTKEICPLQTTCSLRKSAPPITATTSRIFSPTRVAC